MLTPFLLFVYLFIVTLTVRSVEVTSHHVLPLASQSSQRTTFRARPANIRPFALRSKRLNCAIVLFVTRNLNPQHLMLEQKLRSMLQAQGRQGLIAAKKPNLCIERAHASQNRFEKRLSLKVAIILKSKALKSPFPA